MRDNNDRFLDALEEIAGVLRDRPGGPNRGSSESVVDAAERARRDRELEAAEVNLIADCAPWRNSLAHHRVSGRTMLAVTDEVLTRIEKLRSGDPGTFGVFDLDGDGVIGALDPDDPGFLAVDGGKR